LGQRKWVFKPIRIVIRKKPAYANPAKKPVKAMAIHMQKVSSGNIYDQ